MLEKGEGRALASPRWGLRLRKGVAHSQLPCELGRAGDPGPGALALWERSLAGGSNLGSAPRRP